MARVEFGAGITDIVGSINGWTFQRNRSGSIVRTRPRQPKFRTPKSTLVQSAFVGLVQEFQALSPGDKLAWNAFAISNTKVDRFGQVKTLTGQNWFITINDARLRLALGILTVPPTNLLPEAITSFNLTVNATEIEIDTITPNNPTDTGLFIQTSFPNTLTTNNQRSSLRLTETIGSGPFGTINLTAAWEAAHVLPWPPGGVANCINIMVQLVPVRASTGITGVGVNKVSGLDFVGSGISFMEIGSTFIVS